MYDIKTLDVKAGVCVNFNNLPTDFEEKRKNLEETINTCGEKNDNTAADCRLLTQYVISLSCLVT